MTDTAREKDRQELIAMMEKHELTRESVADLLHISAHAVSAWLKPETSKSSNPTPAWALELLSLKLKPRKEARKNAAGD